MRSPESYLWRFVSIYGPKAYTRLLYVRIPLSMDLPHFTKHCGEWMHILNEHRRDNEQGSGPENVYVSGTSVTSAQPERVKGAVRLFGQIWQP